MANKSIIVKKYVNNSDELPAESAITPGMLIELTSSNTYQPHSTADGTAAKRFAKEDSLQGGSIDDAYAADAPVQALACVQGEWILAILADGEDIAIGDKLVSNGDGALKERGGASDAEQPESIVAISRQTLDLSDTSGAESSGPLGYNKRLVVEIM